MKCTASVECTETGAVAVLRAVGGWGSEVEVGGRVGCRCRVCVGPSWSQVVGGRVVGAVGGGRSVGGGRENRTA